MKSNRLQYAYSISVLFGVLATAYLMMSQEGNANVPFRALQTPAHSQSMRMEAQAADPAIQQLMQFESSLSGLKVYRSKEIVQSPALENAAPVAKKK